MSLYMPGYDTVSELWSEIAYSCSPDLADHRYNGPIKIFLSDHWVGSFNYMGEVLKSHRLEHMVDYYQVGMFHTEEQFYCVDVMHKSKPRRYMTRDLEQFDTKDLPLAKVSGKILSISLKALQVIDSVYMNTVWTKRVKIDTTNGEVYAYVANPDCLTKYDYHTKKWNLVSDMTYCASKPKMITVGVENRYALPDMQCS